MVLVHRTPWCVASFVRYYRYYTYRAYRYVITTFECSKSEKVTLHLKTKIRSK